MPTYDYKCKACGAEFELVRKISERDDNAAISCLNCARTGEIERLVSAPMFSYSTVTKGGYGSNLGGFKDVLEKIHRRAPGSQIDKTSSYL